MVSLRTPKGRIEYLDERNRIVHTLRESANELDLEKVRLCIERVIRSYTESSRIKNMTRITKDNRIEEYPFRSVKLYRTINKRDFLSKTFIWEPYFSDVGRAIAWGEQNYIYRRITRITAKGVKEVSPRDVNIRTMENEITKLLEYNTSPDTIIMPIQSYGKFMSEYSNRFEEWGSTEGGYDQVRIAGRRLKIFWSSSFAPARSIVIFDSNASVWHALENDNDGTDITVAIGQPKDNPYKVVYFVEILAFLQIMNKNAFARIKLTD